MTDFIRTLDVVQPYLQRVDHYDCKTIEGEVTLREFIAGALSYYPAWLKALYWIRARFVRLLGMRQDGIPTIPHFLPEDVAFEAGKYATFFKVEDAAEDLYWIASANDSHLNAYLAVVVEPLSDGSNRFHLATIVQYNNWAGPIYFNVIRPFHHIVVRAMMQAGINYRNTPNSQKGLNYA